MEAVNMKLQATKPLKQDIDESLEESLMIVYLSRKDTLETEQEITWEINQWEHKSHFG